jgi:hypothetical protein
MDEPVSLFVRARGNRHWVGMEPDRGVSAGPARAGEDPAIERAASRAGPDAKFGRNQLVRDKLVNLTGR